MDRKYFSYKLKDILSEYEMAMNDGKKLMEIAHELSYRNIKLRQAFASTPGV